MIAALAALAHASESPAALSDRLRRVERTHMAVLGGWAVANLGIGTAGALTAESPHLAAFHGTNAAWNTVNAALAVVGLLGGKRDVSNLDAVRARNHRLRRTLAVNIGLDGLYIASGVATTLVGDTLDKPTIRGVGESVLLQGGFLLVFDLAFYDALGREASVALVPQPNGMMVVGRF